MENKLLPSIAYAGMNLSSTPKEGSVAYALNATIESMDGKGISYQNEEGNMLCVKFPQGYTVIGKKAIIERDLTLLWLVGPKGESEMGTVKQCTYTKLINDPCLGFSLDHPIHKSFYRIMDCGVEVFWTDAKNERRYINLDKLPFRQEPDPSGCGFITTSEIDCNLLRVQPNFSIPSVTVTSVDGGGELLAGTYQFAVQYANERGEGYTSYYSVTNPVSIGDPQIVTPDFNYPVNKSIEIELSRIDLGASYEYINVAVVKTVNNITSFSLIGTYKIEEATKSITYSGQSILQLTENDIFEKFPVYTKADDIYEVGGILGWQGLTLQERDSYQEIASKIEVQWQTWRLKKGAYKDPVNTALYKGHMRDEVYPLEFVPLLTNGHQADGFHIPGIIAIASDLEHVPEEIAAGCDTQLLSSPRWVKHNTATVINKAPEFKDDDCYEGPYEYGRMAYWESSETYPCDESWGSLASQKIRHHKMPDCSVSPHYSDGGEFIYPLGIKIDIDQVLSLIKNSSLTEEQKSRIQGFKIVRGNRAGKQKSVIAKGLLTNVLKYSTQNRIIDIEDLRGTSTETYIQRLITSALTLIKKARSGSIGTAAPVFLGKAQDALNTAYPLEPTDARFTTEIDIAIERLTQASNLSNLSETALSYIEASLQIVQSIKESIELFIAGSTSLPDADEHRYFPNYLFNDVKGTDPYLSNTIIDEDANSRFTFHSPDTSFYQPSLGNILKLELASHGFASMHNVQVDKHARYQFINATAYITSLAVGIGIGFASGMYGVSTKPFDGTAAFTAYQTLLDIIRKVTPRKNPAYQVNAVGHYHSFEKIPDNKEKALNIASYLIPGMNNLGDDYEINNYQRESSVYLRTSTPVPFVHEVPGVPSDISKILVPGSQNLVVPISGYYGAVKRNFPNQWGQMYSYETIDTGFQWSGDINKTGYGTATVFGGDVFINEFAYKSKMPFFTDHRVGVPDESDISYNELSNVGRVKYWFSTDITEGRGAFGSVFGVRASHFYNHKQRGFHKDGQIFLFAYAIPSFFCESEVNVDLRQASNTREGDFYPRVSTGIPDNWLQEANVSIQNDNSYIYNKTFSKQNKENFFSHIPQDYDPSCDTQAPFLSVYSDKNNWFVYRALSRFEFPQTNGRITSIDGLENKAVLVRYENRSQLYNTFLTISTSSPQAAYMGNDTLFKGSPPIDFSEAESGYIGSQHKLLIKTPYGHIFCDARRGQVFLLNGNQPKEISTPEVARFFQLYLDVKGDNHFKGTGLTGVYDPLHKRALITKLDGKASFTISYNFLTQSWVSFHSYLPLFYLEAPTGFYSADQRGIWSHGDDITTYNHFFDAVHPYIIEYPVAYKAQDEILQSVKDYSQVFKYSGDNSFVHTGDYFNKAILSNNQESSGVLNLVPQTSLRQKLQYPKYNADSKDILYSRTDSCYNFNTFWSLTKNNSQPIWVPSQESLSFYKDLNSSNCDYSKRSHKKGPLRSKDLKVRLILDDRSDIKIVSRFLLTENQKSFK